MSFVITCCMLLFFYNLSADTGRSFEKNEIQRAAKLTFGNVLFLSLLCTVVDAVQRKFTVERPVKRIVEGAEKLMQGDFSVRIKTFGEPYGLDGFDYIINCFNQLAQELGGMETLRTDFIANVSHELKTPLSVMRNYGVILQQPEGWRTSFPIS